MIIEAVSEYCFENDQYPLDYNRISARLKKIYIASNQTIFTNIKIKIKTLIPVLLLKAYDIIFPLFVKYAGYNFTYLPFCSKATLYFEMFACLPLFQKRNKRNGSYLMHYIQWWQFHVPMSKSYLVRRSVGYALTGIIFLIDLFYGWLAWFLKTKFSYNQGHSVRTRQLGLFVNIGRLELTYRAQTFRD